MKNSDIVTPHSNELNRARTEAQQSNQELENALNHFQEAVNGQAGEIHEKRETLNHLLGDKRHAAEEFLQKNFKGAEDFINQQTGMIRDALNDTKGEADQFLRDVSQSVDIFVRDVRGSVSHALDFMEDRRAAGWMTVFFVGCLFGSFISRRALGRVRSDTTSTLPVIVEEKPLSGVSVPTQNAA